MNPKVLVARTDSSQPATGAFVATLHPNLQRGTDAVTGGSDANLPSLYPLTLAANQVTSLNNIGIKFLHYNVAGSGDGRPSDSGTAFRFLATGDQVAGLMIPLNTGTTPAWTGHGTTFPDRAFNLNPFNAGGHARMLTLYLASVSHVICEEIRCSTHRLFKLRSPNSIMREF